MKPLTHKFKTQFHLSKQNQNQESKWRKEIKNKINKDKAKPNKVSKLNHNNVYTEGLIKEPSPPIMWRKH